MQQDPSPARAEPGAAHLGVHSDGTPVVADGTEVHVVVEVVVVG